MLGHHKLGNGPEKVIVIHDWFCDTTSYDPVQPYLNSNDYSYVFVDLRGYGDSKEIPGECTAEEAANDIVALADHLKWDKFHVVGHSMSGMVAQYVDMIAGDRVKSITAITPTPACGLGAPEDAIEFMGDAAASNDMTAREIIKTASGNRYNDQFVDVKLEQWRKTSKPEARVAYMHMFCQTDFADQVRGSKTPYQVVCGAHDMEASNREVCESTFGKYYPNVSILELASSGHYPMQEQPIAVATAIENFLEKHSG